MKKIPFMWLVLLLLLSLASASSSAPTTLIFNTVGRPFYAFDIYSLPIQQQPLSPDHEFRLTDGHSVNFNGHFISNTSAIQLPTNSTPIQQLVYVTERNGSPTIYYDAIYTSNSLRIQLPLFTHNTDTTTQLSMKDKPNVTPDGQYIVYVSTHEDPGVPRASWAAVYSTHLQSGLTKRLTPYGLADFSPALSPSGIWTAVASYGGPDGWAGEVNDLTTDIYVFLTRDGTQRIKVAENGGWPTWVDDRTIYFHSRGRGQDQWRSIYRAILPTNAPISLDSVIVQRVTPPGLHAFTPATSPGNNNFIAVATIRPGSTFRHIELFNLVTNEFTELTRLVSPLSHHFNPFISPDSTRVGYHKCRGESPQLLLENIQSPVPDLSLFRVAGEFPAFSPSGDRIAYSSNMPGVYVVNRDGSNLQKVSDAKAFSTAWDPVRPDVIYTAVGETFGRGNAQVDIVSINVDEENKTVTRLTVDGSNNAFPSPSPDGKWIVFRSGRSGNNTKNLYIMDAVGGERKELRRLTEGAWNDTMCSWSPDGEWIVFVSNRDDPGTDSFKLFVIHPNGTGLREVTESGSGGRVNHPCFSPDGKTLAFATDYAGLSSEPISIPDTALPYGEVFIVRLDGSGMKRLTHNSYEDGTLAWSSNYMHPLNNVPSPNAGPYCSFDDPSQTPSPLPLSSNPRRSQCALYSASA